MRQGAAFSIVVLFFLPSLVLAQGLPLPAVGDDEHRVCTVPGLLPERAFQRRLSDEAKRLQDEGRGGVEIWSALTQMAVDHYGAKDELTIQQKFDRVMIDVGAVVVGEGAFVGNVQLMRGQSGGNWARRWLARVTPIPGKNDPLIDEALRLFRLMDDDLLVKDLEEDPETGAQRPTDFRREFDDGSSNQVFHTGFYWLLSYFSGDNRTSNVGSLFHEIVDDGKSYEDDLAGQWGGILGAQLRRYRDDGNEKAFEALPVLVGALFSNDPDAYAGEEYEGVVQAVQNLLDEDLKNPGGGWRGRVTQVVRRGTIGAFSWIDRRRDSASGSGPGKRWIKISRPKNP